MKKKILIGMVIGFIIIILATVGNDAVQYMKYENDYKKAQEYIEQKTYEGYKNALALLEETYEYKDSQSMLENLKEDIYQRAQTIIESNYQASGTLLLSPGITNPRLIEAIQMLELIPYYEFSQLSLRDLKTHTYDRAQFNYQEEYYLEAFMDFKQIQDFKDSSSMLEQLEDILYVQAIEEYKKRNVDGTVKILKQISPYKDSDKLLGEIEILEAKYQEALAVIQDGHLKEGISLTQAIEDYKDSFYISKYLTAKQIYDNQSLSEKERREETFHILNNLSKTDFQASSIRNEFDSLKKALKDIEIQYILTKLAEKGAPITVDSLDSTIEEIYQAYGVKIKYKKDDIKTEHEDYSMTPLSSKEDACRFVEAIRNGLKKYPVALLRENIKDIYLVKSVYKHVEKVQEKAEIGGFTMSSRAKEIHLAYNPKIPWSNENIFHHELAHNLHGTYARSFPKEKWNKLNPNNFTYLDHTDEILHDDNYSAGIQVTAMAKGFTSPYASATMAEDIAELSAAMFTQNEILFNNLHSYKALHEKYKLLVEFYEAIDPVFTDEYFRTVSKY